MAAALRGLKLAFGPSAAAAGVIVAACSWYAYAGRQMYFVSDEWSYWNVLARLPLGRFVWEPYQDSLNAGHFVIWHVLAGAVGMDYWPYRGVTIAFFAMSLVVLWGLYRAIGVEQRNALFLLTAYAFAGPTIGNLLFGWQLAWMGSIAFGLLATRFALQERSSYVVALPLGTAVLMGPPGAAFIAVVIAVAVRVRNAVAIVGAAVVGLGWLAWRSRYLGSPVDAGFGPLHLDYWRFVGSGLVGGFRGSLGSYWSLAAALAALLLVGLAIRRRAPDGPNAAREALAIGGAIGCVCWWLLLAQSRWLDALEIPQSFAADSPRYLHVAVSMLALSAPWTLARLRVSAGALVALAAALVVGGMAWAANWAQPYVDDAKEIRADVCGVSHPTAAGESTSKQLALLRRDGFLSCG